MTTITQLKSLTNNLQGIQGITFEGSKGCATWSNAIESHRFCVQKFVSIFRFVNFTTFVYRIEEIDTDRQRITFDMALAMSWQDSRVSCARCGVAEVTDPDLSQIASENHIQAPPTCSPIAIWVPGPHSDMVTTMDYKEVLGKQLSSPPTLFQNNSNVVVWAVVSITLSCSMSFASFPFDKQTCNLELSLPGMTPTLLAANLTDTDDTLGYNLQVCLDL